MSASAIGTNTLLPDQPDADDQPATSPVLEISNGMVALYKDAFGRGPTKARALFADADTVLIVLEDAFTAAERTLLALGKTELLSESRLTIQQALETPARSVIEQALGRQTVAFVTGIDIRNGIAINLCTLEPASNPSELDADASSNDGNDDG
jgi:uncharacterized protein YbcI